MSNFEEDEIETLRQYFNEYDEGNRKHLLLKDVEKIFDKEFGITGFERNEILDLLKLWDPETIIEITKVNSSDDLQIDFDTFVKLLNHKVIKSEDDITTKRVLENIGVCDTENLSISEVKHYFEVKLGEKLNDKEMRTIFNEVAPGKNFISLEDLIRKIDENKLLE